MGNLIRNDLTLYGPEQRVDQFIGAFLREGFFAHVPIPSDAVSIVDPVTGHRRELDLMDYWGCCGHQSPDVCFKTEFSFGIGFLLKPQDYPEHTRWVSHRTEDIRRWVEGRGSVEKTIARMIKDERPGFVKPQEGDRVGCLKFYTQWSPPFRWIERVINDHYEVGLNFHLHWTDLINLGDTYETSDWGDLWTVDDGNNPWIVSGHCAGWENDYISVPCPEDNSCHNLVLSEKEHRPGAG